MKTLLLLGLALLITNRGMADFNLLAPGQTFQTVPCALDEECPIQTAAVNYNGNFYRDIQIPLDTTDCLSLKQAHLTGTFAITQQQITNGLDLVVEVNDGTNFLGPIFYGIGAGNWTDIGSGRAILDVGMGLENIPKSSKLWFKMSFQGPGAAQPIGLLYWPSNSTSAGFVMRNSAGAERVTVIGTPLLQYTVHPVQPPAQTRLNLSISRTNNSVEIGYPRGLSGCVLEYRVVGAIPDQNTWYHGIPVNDVSGAGKTTFDPAVAAVQGLLFRLTPQ